jgi:hypothetical protein
VHPVNLAVREQYFHHYADSIIAHHARFHADLNEAVQSVQVLDFRPTAAGRFGVNTQSVNGLNYKLRFGFVQRGNWRAEIGWTDALPIPIWLFDPVNKFKPGAKVTEKFDLAFIDEHKNARRIWNLVADHSRLSTPQLQLLKKIAPNRIKAHWDGGCTCLRSSVISALAGVQPAQPVSSRTWTNQSLAQLLVYPGLLPTLDLGAPTPTVLGEIQFGNWALAYRDVGRILAVRQKFTDSPVTLFVIITATGCLADLISEGTVNFDQSRRTLERVGPDLPVPTWLVGIDFDHGASSTHPAM